MFTRSCFLTDFPLVSSFVIPYYTSNAFLSYGTVMVFSFLLREPGDESWASGLFTLWAEIEDLYCASIISSTSRMKSSYTTYLKLSRFLGSFSFKVYLAVDPNSGLLELSLIWLLVSQPGFTLAPFRRIVRYLEIFDLDGAYCFYWDTMSEAWLFEKSSYWFPPSSF